MKLQINKKIDILKIAFQLGSAIKYLTNIGFIHRDINPKNILINLKNLNIKLCGFLS